MKIKKIILVLLVLSFVLSSCSISKIDYAETENASYDNGVVILHVAEIPSSTYSDVYRFVDSDAGVVCWVFSGYKEGGLSCIPMVETNLNE